MSVILCILDGWGENNSPKCNAIKTAPTPQWDALLQQNSSVLLKASGTAVGLPTGQMGNSEVGHTNIGAGRIVEQMLPKLDHIMANFDQQAPSIWQNIINGLKQRSGALHLLGLLSDGGVHSSMDHLLTLAKAAEKADVPVKIHALGDGRDCPPQQLPHYLADLQRTLPDINLCTLVGRYYAMDRDKRWERTRLAWNLWQNGSGKNIDSLAAYLDQYYIDGNSDEMIPPLKIDLDYTGFQQNDALICCNFRIDRMKQIAACFQGNGHENNISVQSSSPKLRHTYSMVPYGDEFPGITPLFHKEHVQNTLGECLASAGLLQLRLAETEKFPHVTYFMNGGTEIPFAGEDRTLVPSPKVASYDLAPQMSAVAIADALIAAIEANRYALIIANFANPDMVGHTGDFAAVCQAIECVDEQLGRIMQAAQQHKRILMVTADHGNAETMWDDVNQQPHTAHTTNPVRFVMQSPNSFSKILDTTRFGILGDIAPTILECLSLPIPASMHGKSLVTELESTQEPAQQAVIS